MPYLPRSRAAWVIAALGVVALLLCFGLGIGFGGKGDSAQALSGYLAAYLFWLGVALGALALTMIHTLTGGAWGYRLRPQFVAAMATLPLLALALLPLLLGADALFPWMQEGAINNAPRFSRQAWYLNEPFLLARAVAFMALWLVLALSMAHSLNRKRAASSTVAIQSSQSQSIFMAIIGLIIYAVSASLFGVDWVMALEPRWHSSVFGMTFMAMQLLSALSWSVCFVVDPSVAIRSDRDSRQKLGDLGTLMMAMLLGSAYLIFMDYLTAWSGDLPSETIWYLPRTQSSWKWLAAFIIACGLLVPFALLLSRRLKRSVAGLRVVAILLLVSNFAFMLWLVLPSLRRDGLWFGVGDLLAFIGLGALWWSVFSSALHDSGHAAYSIDHSFPAGKRQGASP